MLNVIQIDAWKDDSYYKQESDFFCKIWIALLFSVILLHILVNIQTMKLGKFMEVKSVRRQNTSGPTNKLISYLDP